MLAKDDSREIIGQPGQTHCTDLVYTAVELDFYTDLDRDTIPRTRLSRISRLSKAVKE